MELIKQHFDENFNYDTYDGGSRFIIASFHKKTEVKYRGDRDIGKYQVNTARWNNKGEEWELWEEHQFNEEEEVIKFVNDFYFD